MGFDLNWQESVRDCHGETEENKEMLEDDKLKERMKDVAQQDKGEVPRDSGSFMIHKEMYFSS